MNLAQSRLGASRPTGPGLQGRVGGFTLLELLVVVAILGLLAAYVGPRFFGQIGRSEQTAARAQIGAFERALEAYRVDMGQYPTNEQGLIALFRNPGASARWHGPYIKKEPPPDPWGRPYVYRVPGTGGRDFDVLSYGRDGRQGGEKEDADVLN
jgi:general secretion pathway protein G